MSTPLQLTYLQALIRLSKQRFRSNKSSKLNVLFIGITALVLSGCSGEEIKPLHKTNPAADYCLTLHGTLETIEHINGDVSLCTLPSGEIVDSWELFRRNHQQS